MSNKSKNERKKWEQFRFSIIGKLLAKPPKRGELQQELERLAQEEYIDPQTGEIVTFGFSTIERWYYQALKSNDPVKALRRKIRKDAGTSTAISPQLFTILKKQYEDYPHWSYKLHSDNLEAYLEKNPELGEAPSYSSVTRRMKRQGWYKKLYRRKLQTPGYERAQDRLAKREVRGWESEYVHSLWHADFHEGKRVVDVHGNWHTPKVLCILDDRSRLCCHIQWYLSETAETFIHGLTQAFQKRGLPRSLMTDNGSAMIANETQNGLLRLGIVHEKTLPYSPYQNGKQEIFWSQLEGRLMAMLTKVEPLTLEFLNRATYAWVELEYNRSYHEELSTTPLTRVLQGPSVSRPSPETDTFRFMFTLKERRTQRRSDGTISIQGVRFEVPSRFRHLKHLFVRYQSWDLSLAYLIDERNDDLLTRIYPQDKTKNAHGYRRALESSVDDLTQVKDKTSDPIPPLLRKILSDYAATGLPPAYVPKEELPFVDEKEKKNHEG
jgi:transposase InsO family protein